MSTRTRTIRCLLILALLGPLGLLVVGSPPGRRAPDDPLAGSAPAPADLDRVGRDEVHAELRGLVGRGGRFTHLKIKHPDSNRSLIFIQDRGLCSLLIYVPRRDLDDPARARLAGVLHEAGLEPAEEAGDFVMAWVYGPDLAAVVAVQVFREVYQLGPECVLSFSGYR